MTANHKQSDHELINMLRSGNHAAYMQIYDRYSQLLQQQAYKKLGNADDVQDVMQQLFTDLWEKRATLNISGDVSGYLFTAIKNKTLNHIYRKKRESAYLESLQEFIDEGNFLTDIVVREKELSAIIKKEIEALPDRTREAFTLSREEGLSHKEIAEKMGISETTVTKQISNAIKILRKQLGSLFFLLFILP